MKNNLIWSLAAFAFVLLAFRKEQKNNSPYPFENSSLLWQIEGNGVPKGSYLFGTMHLIEKDKFLFPKSLRKLIASSDQIVMEIAGMPDPMEAMQYVMLKEGSFFDYFNEEQTDSILNWAKTKTGMDEKTFRGTMQKMKPFVVVQMAMQMQYMGKTASYEMSIDSIAKANKITVLGLETIAQQMSFFDDLSKEKQAEMVMESIRDDSENEKIMQSMQNLYVRQQVDSLYMLINEEGGVIASEEHTFLKNRNENWIPQIKKMIAEKKTFIAVGAGHLGGPDGVIRLLEKEGYTLTPVKVK